MRSARIGIIRGPNLAALNIATFTSLSDLIGVRSEFVRSSELGVPGSSSQRVLDVCKAVGATRYISGPSARSYLDEPSFEAAGIELCYHRFVHPQYRQLHGDFVPNLSVVDLIANEVRRRPRSFEAAGRRFRPRSSPTKPDLGPVDHVAGTLCHVGREVVVVEEIHDGIRE